jgi:hypothetical protein
MNEQKKPNIYQRINAVMLDVSYIQKDKSVSGGGANYKAVTHDQVVSAVRASLVKHGIVIEPKQMGGQFIVMRDLNATPQPVKMGLYSGDYEINFVNIDDPTDRTVVSVQAHASDNGDKAPGKAMTYAVKTAVIKQFYFETGEDDESREDIKDTSMIDEQTVLFLEQKMIEVIDGTNQWTKKGQRLLQKYRLGSVAQLKESKLAAFKKDLGA